jgi:uncharacterized RDD family membrane protein YckC
VNHSKDGTNSDSGETIYVGFWIRMFAFLIDNIALVLLVIPLIRYSISDTDINLQDYNLQDAEQLSELLNLLLIQFSVDAVLLGAIFILFWIVKSATPGKMVLGCSIVDARTLGKASNSQNIIRYIGYYISLIPVGLGFIWIGFDAHKQGWHDKLANTVVIKGRPHGSAQVDKDGSPT